MTLMVCRKCGRDLSMGATTCPSCNTNTFSRNLDALVAVSIVLFFLLVITYYTNHSSADGRKSTAVSAAPAAPVAVAPAAHIAPAAPAPAAENDKEATPEELETAVTRICSQSYTKKRDLESCKKREYRAKAELENLSTIPTGADQKCETDEVMGTGYAGTLNCFKAEIKKKNAHDADMILRVCDSTYKNARDSQACQVRERDALNTLNTQAKLKNIPPAVSAKCNADPIATTSNITLLKCVQDGMAAAGK